MSRMLGLWGLVAMLFVLAIAIPCHALDRSLANTPDPAIIQVGDDYYIFSTGEKNTIRHSRDLIHWQVIGEVFEDGTPQWAREKLPRSAGLWAPDITYVQGRYRLYYAVSIVYTQNSCIGLVENKTLDPNCPDYQWVDKGLVIESREHKQDYNAIDPALFVDDDGRNWLSFGSYFSGLKLIELDPDTGKLKSDQAEMVTLAVRPQAKAIEAPFIIYRQGYYYLFVSFDYTLNGFDSTYKVMVGRSQRIEGPYLDFQGQPMTAGHATLVLANHDH